MKIPYVNLSLQNQKVSKKLVEIFKNIVISGAYVGGSEINLFEKNIAKFY